MHFIRTQKHWIPVVLWMGVIFCLSTHVGSSENTGGLIVPLLRFFFPHIEEATIDTLHTLIRKTAHLTEYAILALLTLRAVRISLRGRPSFEFYRMAGITLIICAAYAATDEFHQLFVPTRGPSLVDVLIDSTGAAAGLILALIVRGISRWRVSAI